MRRRQTLQAALVWMMIALGAVAYGAAPAHPHPALADGDAVQIRYAIWDQAADAPAPWRIFTTGAPARGEAGQDAGLDSVTNPAPVPAATVSATEDADGTSVRLLDPEALAGIPSLWVLAFLVLALLFLSTHHQGGGHVVAVRVRRAAHPQRHPARRR